MPCWKTKLRIEGKLAVAFSGGCDSTFLAEAAKRILGPENVLLLLADSLLLPRVEFDRALGLAAELKLPLEVVSIAPLDDPAIRANDPLRCYHCKKRIFRALLERAVSLGFTNLADGANADDAADYRPGARAADELGILHPLKEFTKAEIRAQAHEWELTIWNLPAAACLASRIPTGIPLEEQALRQIEASELYLASLGFTGCRVRRLSDSKLQLEFPAEQLQRAKEMQGEFSRLGFSEIVIAPYRTGSMNAKPQDS